MRHSPLRLRAYRVHVRISLCVIALASYSQQSQRYVNEEAGFDYVIPQTIKEMQTLKNYL